MLFKVSNHDRVFIKSAVYQVEWRFVCLSYNTIVENRQLFINIEQTLKFTQQYCNLNVSVDVIFGAGNEISNALHASFLKQYTQIYMLLDMDLGGLIIAKNLLQLLPEQSIFWLQPIDIEQRLQKVMQRCSADDVNKMIAIGQQYPALRAACHVMVKYHKCLEQESYLDV